MANNETCSKCSGPLDTAGSPKWCKACRAKYQREYNETRVDRGERRGFAEGVDAFRDLISTEFARLGSGMFSGYEIADIVSRVPAPRPE